jgi:ESAT-6 family protein
MPAFSVDLQALLAAVDQMSAFNERLEQSLARVKSSMATLGPLWRGDAAAAQQSAQQQWDSGAEELRRRWVSCATSPRRHTETIPTLRR